MPVSSQAESHVLSLCGCGFCRFRCGMCDNVLLAVFEVVEKRSGSEIPRTLITATAVRHHTLKHQALFWVRLSVVEWTARINIISPVAIHS